MEARKDYGTNADSWFLSIDQKLTTIANLLRLLIKNSVPKVTESIKWGTPNYEKNGYICALRAGKGYIAIQFGSVGIDLNDPDKLLEGSGKKMRHVKIFSEQEIKKELFTSWIKQAAEI